MPGLLTYDKIWLTSSTHPDTSLFYLNNQPLFNLSAEGQHSRLFL